VITITFDESLIPADLNREWVVVGDIGPYIVAKNKFKNFVQDVGEAVLSVIYYNPSTELMARSANDTRNSPALRLANYIILSERGDLRKTGETEFVKKYKDYMNGKNVRDEVLASYDIMSGGKFPNLGDWTDNLNKWMRGELTNVRAVPVAYVMALLSNKMHQSASEKSPSIVAPKGTFDFISDRVTIPFQHMQLSGQIAVSGGSEPADPTQPGKGGKDLRNLDKYGGGSGDEEFPWALLVGGLAVAGLIVYLKVKGDSYADR
jgi:hypothetical protein